VSNSNRHVLSLRSCVPCEVDWSLDRLMIISGNDPDLLRFDELAGLLDGLFNLVQAFLDATGGRDDFHARVFMSGEGDVVRRRATEAAMILRNLSTEKVNQAALLGYSKLAQVVTGALDQFEEEQSAMESTAEMRIYLLEILEIVGEKLPLVLPGRSLSREDGAELEDLSSPSVRLFPLLVTLTRSSDRALVLASFRCLTALAVNNKSDLVFAMVTYDPSSPHPHPIQTAVELLPIADAEISAAALDFIYQHTLLPSNSALFCARPDLVHILRVVCSKLHFGAKRETLEVSIPMPDSEGARYVNAQPPRFRVPVRAEGPVEIGPRFDGEEERRWMSLPDPQRTLAW
jgi:chromatin structure-remodeling complex subunit RSC9